MKLKKILFLLMIFIISLSISSYAKSTTSINSGAGILVEVSTGKIIYEKNSTKQLYPASTTKILTAILVLEKCNLSDMVTVTESAISNIPSGYVTCNLQIGEEISVKDLLYALMLPSANDAAYVLAEHVGGTVDNFSTMMNNKAIELGCKNTHFVNPNGIHNDKHYSTAYDLYLIANYAMQNETFKEIVKTTEYTLPATNAHSLNDRILKTTNSLLDSSSQNYYYKYAIGIKTGFTSQAGNCLVAESSRDGLEFIAVVLNGGKTNNGLNSRFIDAIKLFNYAYDNYTLTKIIEKNSIVNTIEVPKATRETKNLDLIIDKSITVINNKSIDINQVIPEITLNEEIKAPVEKGTVLGKIKYKVDDIEYTANLLANSNVEKQTYYNIIIIAGLILLLVSIILINKTKSKKSKKNKKNKKKSVNLY